MLEIDSGSEAVSLKLSLPCLIPAPCRSQREALDSGDLDGVSVFNQSTFLVCQVQAGAQEMQLAQTRTQPSRRTLLSWGGGKDRNLTLCKCPNGGCQQVGVSGERLACFAVEPLQVAQAG